MFNKYVVSLEYTYVDKDIKGITYFEEYHYYRCFRPAELQFNHYTRTFNNNDKIKQYSIKMIKIQKIRHKKFDRHVVISSIRYNENYKYIHQEQ